MAMDISRIAQLERELEEARAQLWKEDGDRYRVVWREIAEDEKRRILESLTDKKERILFGLDAPDDSKRDKALKPGGSGGDMTCSLCGKRGLTKRGLGLHMVRLHKEAKPEEGSEEAPLARAGRL